MRLLAVGLPACHYGPHLNKPGLKIAVYDDVEAIQLEAVRVIDDHLQYRINQGFTWTVSGLVHIDSCCVRVISQLHAAGPQQLQGTLCRSTALCKVICAS